MSALAHYLEEEGIASVAIALIRPQAENTRPPRALWVPFELGRPLGPPSDKVFQRRVILAALGMLERSPRPVLIEDFPDDDPREAADTAWQSPSARLEGGAAEGSGLVDELAAELHGLARPYAQSCTERGRSTVGLTGLAPAACADYAVAWLRGPTPASPVKDMSPVLALRFVSDDLKAFALEAALAGAAKPSSRQLGDWLWNQTALGTALHALRRRLLAGDDERSKAVAAFLVPALRLPPGS